MLPGYEALTENFYRWEKRGRGWLVWDYAVELEPPFEPFYHRYSPSARPIDDARKPTLLSSFFEKMLGKGTGATANSYDEIAPDGENISEPEPVYRHEEGRLVSIRVTFPPDLNVTTQTSEQFLLSLSHSAGPIAFELIGQADSITVQISCRERDVDLVCQQLRAYFPEAVVTPLDLSEDLINDKWDGDEGLVIDFGLSQEFMRPLRTFKSFEVDPLIAITGALGGLRDGEMGVLQVLFQGVRHPWAENIMRAVTDWEGHSFFTDAPEMLGLAREKVERPLFAVVLRAAAISNDLARSGEIVKALGGALTQFASPGSNELIPLADDDYEEFAHELEFMGRQTRRSGMILNSKELVSLVHLPSISVRTEKFKRELRKTRAAPSIATGNQLILGENTHHGKKVSVTLSPEQRLRHMHVIGATGTGKSTLLLNLIIQDIEKGTGVGVIDPHGDLIDQILGYIPEKRFDDVVLFDPADTDYPIGFNILSAHSELEKNILGSDLGAVFRRLSTSWGDQMTSVLGNAILAFLESDKGGTLVDLRRFLIDQDQRNTYLKTVNDPQVAYFWQKEFPLLSGKPQGPVLTRLDTFLRPKLIRNMVSQKENRINFHEILNRGKILLVKLAQGLVGEENAYLLGAFIVSKLHQVVMGRQEVGETERRNFYLYIDEFQNFITPSMAAILSGARKYHLGLVLSHQDLEQLWKRDSEVASSVISNPATRICFRLGDFDAKKLEDGFSNFQAEDLQNLGVGEAICRIERAEYDFNLKTLPLPSVAADLARHRKGQLIVLSREKYARRREEVEPEIFKEEPAAAPPPRKEERPKEEKKERPAVERILREVKKEAKEKPRPAPQEPAPLGRGGQQHKYLQSLIKRMAEDRGYRATIEKEILGGLGSVDVALEKDGRSIACEISVTSTVEYEIGNIQKCLAAGFENVVLISTDRKTLNKAKDSVSSAVSEQEIERVRFLTPEELFSFLEEQEAQVAGKEETVRGYKVKVKYRPIDETEKKAKKQAIANTILQAMRRLKGK